MLTGIPQMAWSRFPTDSVDGVVGSRCEGLAGFRRARQCDPCGSWHRGDLPHQTLSTSRPYQVLPAHRCLPEVPSAVWTAGDAADVMSGSRTRSTPSTAAS